MTTIDLLIVIFATYLAAGVFRYVTPRLPRRWSIEPNYEGPAGAWLAVLGSVAITLLAAVLLHSRYRKGGGMLEPGESAVGAGLWLMIAMATGFLAIARFPSRGLRPGLISTLLLVVLAMALVGVGLWWLELPILGANQGYAPVAGE
jgi:hypothetical protein